MLGAPNSKTDGWDGVIICCVCERDRKEQMTMHPIFDVWQIFLGLKIKIIIKMMKKTCKKMVKSEQMAKNVLKLVKKTNKKAKIFRSKLMK